MVLVQAQLFWETKPSNAAKNFDAVETVEDIYRDNFKKEGFWPKSVVHTGHTFVIFSKKLFQKVRVWTKNLFVFFVRPTAVQKKPKSFLFKPSFSEQSFLEKIKTSVLYINNTFVVKKVQKLSFVFKVSFSEQRWLFFFSDGQLEVSSLLNSCAFCQRGAWSIS